jgi:hypothetical protein
MLKADKSSTKITIKDCLLTFLMWLSLLMIYLILTTL